MVEEAKELQAKDKIWLKLQKDAEALSNEEITELQKDIQENGQDLEFILEIQAKQNETVQSVATELNAR